MPGASRFAIGVALLALGTLAACSSTRKIAGDNAPTLKSLADRQVVVEADAGVATSPEEAIAAYQDFLKASPRDRQRPEAMRRLGDLEMDSADGRIAEATPGSTPTAIAGNVAAEYRGAIARYLDYLQTYPIDPGNDRVLYQLARAYELGGDLDTALKTLDRLVQQFPATRYGDEAHFRRGELLFTSRNYAAAEKAFATVLRSDSGAKYHERSLYMQGWAVFKQARLEEALQSFFGVLDLKLAGRDVEAPLEEMPGLTRADREVVEDTFRVTSLSLQNLQGADSIPVHINSVARRGYEYRVYEQLGELYLKQERIKDAADTLAAFARRNPLHPQAPVLQARVIGIYQDSGFASLALVAKRDYVEHYGARSELRRTNAAVWERAQPLVKANLTELAQHFHASAQKSKTAEDVAQAVRWYRELLVAFPSDAKAAESNFLLAELLFEDKRYGEAAIEYQKAAYDYPPHAKSADAGYAALLACVEQDKRAAPAEHKALQLASGDSALRFAATFVADPRRGPVLSNAAEKLYALGQADRAVQVAQQVLALKPPAADAQRRVASLVIAHASFDRGAFEQSEQNYRDVLALTPERDPGRGELVERVAASIYRQGEQARAGNRLRDAVGHFARVAVAAPGSTVAATAQYDAAAALIALKDWDAAAQSLEDFRGRYPKHPLQAEVGSKLAVIHVERGQWAQAGSEFERLAAARGDTTVARGALWQAAELYEKAGAAVQASRTYERYIKQYPQPLEPSLEARYRLATLARKEGQRTRELTLLKELLLADQAAGQLRTDRTRYLGAQATLVLAEPVRDEYRKVQLVEPLKRQLALKKAKMEELLKAYARAADYGVADVATAATFHIAEVYGEFGRALLASQRPKGLKKLELEQYNVLLEEQAYPFEEKAIELHEINAQRSSKGIYDDWVKRSFTALAKLRPVRFGKVEISQGTIHAIR